MQTLLGCGGLYCWHDREFRRGLSTMSQPAYEYGPCEPAIDEL
ncbi:uncharacterized protein METZ01_LOCUS309290, partial [marine metagenome]